LIDSIVTRRTTAPGTPRAFEMVRITLPLVSSTVAICVDTGSIVLTMTRPSTTTSE